MHFANLGTRAISGLEQPLYEEDCEAVMIAGGGGDGKPVDYPLHPISPSLRDVLHGHRMLASQVKSCMYTKTPKSVRVVQRTLMWWLSEALGRSPGRSPGVVTEGPGPRNCLFGDDCSSCSRAARVVVIIGGGGAA